MKRANKTTLLAYTAAASPTLAPVRNIPHKISLLFPALDVNLARGYWPGAKSNKGKTILDYLCVYIFLLILKTRRR